MPTCPAMVGSSKLPMMDRIPISYALSYLRRSTPPRVWTAFVTFFAALLANIVIATGVLFAAVAIMHEPGAPMGESDFTDVLSNPRVFLVLAGAVQFGILAIVALAVWLSPQPAVQRLRLGPSNASPI